VVKKYSYPQESLSRETEVLTHLYQAGLAVPAIIHAGADHLVMEYIQGLTLLEWLEIEEKKSPDITIRPEALKLIEKLAHWLKRFYAITSLDGNNYILGDVNLRNFIAGDKLYGLDFESRIKGRIEEDLGKLCAFTLTYHPPFTAWKYKLVDSIIEIIPAYLNVPAGSVTLEMSKELAEIAMRRSPIEKYPRSF